MVSAIILVVVFLAALFLAFVGVFGRFPDEWEWVGIMFAAVGLVMAAPTIFQMVWGRPLVRVRFDRGVEDGERLLPMYLENPPVKNRLIKRLGVRRQTVQSLTAQFQISEVGSRRIIVPIHQARIYADDDPTDAGRPRIALPPTFSVAACILLVRWDAQNNKAVIPEDRLRQPVPLEPGYYLANIVLLVDGEPQHFQHRFVVGRSADDLNWSN